MEPDAALCPTKPVTPAKAGVQFRAGRAEKSSIWHADARPLDSGFRRNDGCVDNARKVTSTPSARDTERKTGFTDPCKSAVAAAAEPDGPSCIE
jgi:hypothetical protein